MTDRVLVPTDLPTAALRAQRAGGPAFGTAVDPAQEQAFFVGQSGGGRAAADVVDATQDEQGRAYLRTAFFSLSGPESPLPWWIQEAADSDDGGALRAMLDVPQHRLVSLAMRMRERVMHPSLRQALGSTGAGTAAPAPDGFAFQAALLMTRQPGPGALAAMLHARWPSIRFRVIAGRQDRVRIDPRDQGQVAASRLGSTIIGRTMASVTSTFHVELGPFADDAWRDFMPGGCHAADFAERLQAADRDGLDIIVTLHIARGSLPVACLGAPGAAGLGRGTRLSGGTADLYSLTYTIHS